MPVMPMPKSAPAFAAAPSAIARATGSLTAPYVKMKIFGHTDAADFGIV